MKRKNREEKLTPCEEKALVTLQAREIKEKQQKAKARARKKAKVGSQVQLGTQGGVALAGQNLPFFMPSAPAAVTSFTPSFTAPAARVPSEWSNIASNLSQTALQYALFNQGNWKREAAPREAQASQVISRAVGPGPVMISQGVNTAPAIPPRPPKLPIKQEDPLRPPKIQQPVEIPFGSWFLDPNANMNRADWDPLYRFQQKRSTRLKREAIENLKSMQSRNEQKLVNNLAAEFRAEKSRKSRGLQALISNAAEARASGKLTLPVKGLGFTPGKSNTEVIDPNRIVTSPPQADVIDPNQILKTPSKQNEEKNIEMTPITRNKIIQRAEEFFSGEKPLNAEGIDLIYGSGTVTALSPINKKVSFTDSTKPNNPSSEYDVINNSYSPSVFTSPAPSTPASAYQTAKSEFGSERFFSANPIKGLGFNTTPNSHSAIQRLNFSANKSQSLSSYTPPNEKNWVELSQISGSSSSASSSIPLNVNIISDNNAESQQLALRQQQLQEQLQEQVDAQKQINVQAAQQNADQQALLTQELVGKSNEAVASSIAARLTRSRRPSTQYDPPVPLIEKLAQLEKNIIRK